MKGAKKKINKQNIKEAYRAAEKCSYSDLVINNVNYSEGFSIGMSRQKVEKILGKPVEESIRNVAVYGDENGKLVVDYYMRKIASLTIFNDHSQNHFKLYRDIDFNSTQKDVIKNYGKPVEIKNKFLYILDLKNRIILPKETVKILPNGKVQPYGKLNKDMYYLNLYFENFKVKAVVLFHLFTIFKIRKKRVWPVSRNG